MRDKGLFSQSFFGEKRKICRRRAEFLHSETENSIFMQIIEKIICITAKKDLIKGCLMLQFKKVKFILGISLKTPEKVAGDIDENV